MRFSGIVYLFLVFAFPCLARQEANVHSSERDTYVFEGRVVEVSSELTPTIHRGHVLSGTLDLVSMALGAASGQSIVLENTVSGGELTLDRNHIATYSANLREAENFASIHKVADASNNAELVSMHLPLSGEITPGRYTAVWLEIFLRDESKAMLSGKGWSDALSAFEDAWFYLTFQNIESGGTVNVAGEVVVFSNAAETAPDTDRLEEYRALMIELDKQLQVRDARIVELEEDLARREAELRSREVIITELRGALDQAVDGSALADAEQKNAFLETELRAARERELITGSAMSQLAARENALAEENARLTAELKTMRSMEQTDDSEAGLEDSPMRADYDGVNGRRPGGPSLPMDAVTPTIKSPPGQPQDHASPSQALPLAITPEKNATDGDDNAVNRIVRRGPRR